MTLYVALPHAVTEGSTMSAGDITTQLYSDDGESPEVYNALRCFACCATLRHALRTVGRSLPPPALGVCGWQRPCETTAASLSATGQPTSRPSADCIEHIQKSTQRAPASCNPTRTLP